MAFAPKLLPVHNLAPFDLSGQAASRPRHHRQHILPRLRHDIVAHLVRRRLLGQLGRGFGRDDVGREEAAGLVPPQFFVVALQRSSSSCEPCSTMRPASSTIRRSMRAMVDRRCAIAITVLPSIRPSSCSWIASSTSLSSAEVASSSTRIGASLSTTRAIAMRWRWPPESLTPRSPTCAS